MQELSTRLLVSETGILLWVGVVEAYPINGIYLMNSGVLQWWLDFTNPAGGFHLIVYE